MRLQRGEGRAAGRIRSRQPVRLQNFNLPRFRNDLLGPETLPRHPPVLLVPVKTDPPSRATSRGLLQGSGRTRLGLRELKLTQRLFVASVRRIEAAS
jgi:hypothetical protein